MQAAVVFLAIIACASAGGITGYSTGNVVTHAHVAAPVAAPAVLAAGPVGYAAPVVAAPIAKAIAPAAVSHQFVNRAPAARVLAAPVAPVVAAAPAIAPVPAAYGAILG